MATMNQVGVALSGASGTGSFAGTTSPSFTTPALGTPTAGVLSSCTGYAQSALTGLGTGVSTALGQSVSGSGSIALTTSPTFITPILGTPTSGNLANCTGYPAGSITGQVTLANGGTSASLTASNGGIFYSTGSAGAILSGTATAGQIILSGSSSAPSWSTSTYPSTNAINTLLYASSANTMAALATVNSSSLVTSSTGVPAWSGAMTNGQVIIGSTGATPTAATLTQGTGISITNGGGTITIAATGGGVAWAGIAGTTQNAAVNSGYVVQNAAQTTITLPATAAIGDEVLIRGLGAGGWILTANTGQTIKAGSQTTSSAGTLTSSEQYDNIDVTCIVANTTWSISAMGPISGLTIA